MYGCESWTIKKGECWRIDAFELWCRRRLLRVPRTASWSNQSILKEISPEYSLEGLMLKLKLQSFATRYKELTHWEKNPDAGKDWSWEEKGPTEDEMVGWHHRLSGHEFELTPAVDDGQGGLACYSPWDCKQSDMTKWLSWAELCVWNYTKHWRCRYPPVLKESVKMRIMTERGIIKHAVKAWSRGTQLSLGSSNEQFPWLSL